MIGLRALPVNRSRGSPERDAAPGDGLLRPRRAPKMMYPLVRELADDDIPVAVTCRVLGFSKQAYYSWLKAPVTERDWDDAHLINAAIDIHSDDPEFGYRFITDELAGQGLRASRNRVNRLCTSSGCGRCTPANAGSAASPAGRSTTTSSNASRCPLLCYRSCFWQPATLRLAGPTRRPSDSCAGVTPVLTGGRWPLTPLVTPPTVGVGSGPRLSAATAESEVPTSRLETARFGLAPKLAWRTCSRWPPDACHTTPGRAQAPHGP